MLSTKINSPIPSVSGSAGKKENVRLYNEIRTHLRSAEVTYNERTKLAQILKDHLRNGSPEEQEEALQVITAICTEDYPDSITSAFFSILITEEKLNLEECLCAQSDWAIRSKILEAVVKSTASIPSNIFLKFIHNDVVKSVFMTKNENIRTLLSEFVLTLSSNYGIQQCDRDTQQKAFETFKNSYVPVIEDLRKNDNRVWYRLCMFTLSYFGKLIHTEIDLINILLNNIEHGFKSKTVEDKLLSFDCWKVLIDVSSLDHSYLCSSKQLKLLVKPCKVKLSRHDQVTCKRLEVWSHLLAALQENSTASLEEFMNFCYEPLPADMWNNGHPAWSDVIKNSWTKRTEILMNLIGHYGHDGSCIQPETFKLNSPVITGANLLKYKSPILNALSVCSENMLFWEVKSAREKKIKCLWGSIFKIISNVDLMTKETVLRDIFVILKKFFEKSQNSDSQDYFDDILQHAFGVMVSEELCDFTILNDLIVFPLTEVMVGCPELLEYKVITFMKFFRTCSKTGSRLEYFNRSCDLLKTYKHSGTQMLSAYIWLELSNELLSICKAPRDEFEEFKVNAQFLMTMICQSYIPENLEQKIFDRWKSILVEIDVISDLFKENLLEDMEKLLKENPGLSSKILGFLNCISNLMTDKSTLNFVTKLLDIILQCTKNPLLSGAKLRTIVPIITKFQSHISKTDKNKSEPLALKLFDCIESFLKPHQAYETLKLFKTILPKLPQNLKKTLPSSLRSIINDLTTHSNAVVAQDAIALLAELERTESNGNQTFVKPLVSTRSAKIASMSNGNVASMFAQEVSKSPVRVKGSQIANKVQRSSRTMKIANAMPSFKSPSIDLDANSSDFVFIDKEVKLDTSKLNAHQKEAMLKRREDIPALYQDLSQSQHTNDSLSKGSSCTMDNEEIKSDNFKDMFDNDKGVILDKLAAHALSPKVTAVEEKEQLTSAKKETKKRARLSLKTTPKRNQANLTKTNLTKTPKGDNQSTEFTDDVLQKDEKPVVPKTKTPSLESLDESSKILLDSQRSEQKTTKDLPKNKEDQVLVPSDADETLCSQAIEEAQNSESKHTSEEKGVQKKIRRRVSELQKIKMDIVGADEFIGLGRKRNSTQKVLDDFVSPFRKNAKKNDPESQISEVEQSQASEPLIPTIGKAITEAAVNEESPRKRGRPFKKIDVNTDKSNNTGMSRKAGRPRKSPTPTKPAEQSDDEVTSIDSETIISDDRDSVTEPPLEPVKRKGRRKSSQMDHEPQNNKDTAVDAKIINSDDKAVSNTSKPAKRKGRRKSTQMDDDNNVDVASFEIINSDDKALGNTPSAPAKRRGPSTLIEYEIDDQPISNITNTPSEPPKRKGRKSIAMDGDTKKDDNITETMAEEPTEPKAKAAPNLEADIVIANKPKENEESKDSTEKMCKMGSTTNAKGQNDPESGHIEKKLNKIVKTPVNTNNRRTRKSLAKEAKEKSLDADTAPTSKRCRKSPALDRGVKSDDASSKNVGEDNSPKIIDDTSEITETIESDHKQSRKRAIITEDHEGRTNTENPTSDISNTENENKSPDIIISELCSISEDIVADTQEDSAAPAVFKEPPSKLQKTEILEDDDDCIIESSQPVETTVYTFNKTGRRSINVKDIQNTVSDELLKCIVGDHSSSPIEDVIKLEEETITIKKIVAPSIGEDLAKSHEELSEALDGIIHISDTLDTCDVTASCNPDETVASVQEKTDSNPDDRGDLDDVVTTNRELFPVRRDHILIDLDLDALPMGFDAFEKENLPGSPIADDTTHRNSELLNNTLDISPIIETREQTEEEVGKAKEEENPEEKCTTPLGTPTRFMKTASSRSAKLMNMLPIVQRAQRSPKSLVRRTQASITSSPTTDRIKRMMMKCNDKVNVPPFDLKDGAEPPPHVLEFIRDVPSPFATPNGSILKRKAEEALEAGLSPLPKRKRVNFSDPPTTCEKIYFKEVNDEDCMDGICAISELNVKKSCPIYPPLTECTIDIREVLTHIRQENLLDHFLAIDIKTAGDLAKLNSTQINQLEFLSNPRLSTITQALSAFADKLLSNVNHEPSPPREETSTQDNSEAQGVSEDVMEDGSRIRDKAVKMWSDLKKVLNRKELEYISDDLHKNFQICTFNKNII